MPLEAPVDVKPVSPAVVSVAVKVYEPDRVTATLEKVATPLTALTEVVDAPVKAAPVGLVVRANAMVSPEPVPEETRLPYWSST